MSAGKRRSLCLATRPANNVEIHPAVAAVVVPSTQGLEGIGKAGELPMPARHRGDQQAGVGRRPPLCNECVPRLGMEHDFAGQEARKETAAYDHPPVVFDLDVPLQGSCRRHARRSAKTAGGEPPPARAEG